MASIDSIQLSPNYSIEFSFERSFEHRENREWMKNHWHESFYWVAIYMILVFGIKAYMKDRQPFHLRKALAIWSTILAVFSIFGFLRTLPEMLHILKNHGFYQSVCNPSYVEVTRVSGYWTWMFALSKVPELGDTIFIVLRKQKLIFLHWYHHITVLMFTWYFYWQHISPARWYVVMNYFVHSIMYTYYALRALNYRLPKSLAMSITVSQIVQMIIGCYVTYYGYAIQNDGRFCQITEGTAKLGLVMYGSYFILFAHFFVTSYFARTNRIKDEQTCHKQQTEQINQKTDKKID